MKKTKEYEVRFALNGESHSEIIKTSSSHEARELIKAQYPGAKVNSVSEA